MAFSYKRIIDLTALSLKDLNDQLEMLWKKVMGGVTADDLYAGASEAIVSSSPGQTRKLKIENDDLLISTSSFTLKILDPDDPSVSRLTMSADMNGFDCLAARRIDAGAMCLVNERDAAEFFISPWGSDAADGLSADTPLKTVAEALRRAPKVGTRAVEISLKRGCEFYESVNIYGYSGTVTLSAYGVGVMAKLHGKIYVEGCGGFTMSAVDVQDDNVGAGATLRIRYTPFEVRLSKFARGSGADAAIAAVSTFASPGVIRNTELTGYNIGVSAGRGCAVQVESCTGVCNTPVEAEGSVVTGSAGWPQYVVAQYSETCGGKVLTAGTSTQAASLTDPAASVINALYRATAARVFRDGANDPAATEVFQGAGGGSAYATAFIMDYAALKAELAGKTLLAARLYLAVREVGSASARIHLVGFAPAAMSGSACTVAADYGYVATCPATGGTWFGIPTAAVADIVSGAAAALGFSDDAAGNYLRAYGPDGVYSQQPRLEVTYN